MYGRLVLFVVLCYIFTFWYVWAEKNLATLPGTRVSNENSGLGGFDRKGAWLP
jgi:hypothetical protein